nr:hypothetical protein [Tanacetum cinerariifolium]
DVSQGEACPTDSGFIADQDRAKIDKSSTLPHDSAPRVTSLVADEGSMQQIIPELTALCTSLQRQLLDDVVPTASLVFATVVTPYRRRKGKEVMVESKTPKKQKVQEQIDAQVARELEEQLEREDQRRNNLGWKVKDFRGMTFKEVEAKFNSVWKQIEDFIPMGSKEESERIKRKGLSLEQESAKKQKTSDEVPEEAMSPEEVPEEKVKEMMYLVLIEKVYVEALQVKHPIIYWKVYTKGQRSYWKITRLGGSSTSYQFFIYLLKHLDREDLNQLWRLVKETLSNRLPTSGKEMEL